MDDRIEVTLHSPAKVDLRTLLPGNHLVSADDLELLKEAGVVVSVVELSEGLTAMVPAFEGEAFDAAVQVAAKLLAGQAFDGALVQMESDLNELMADIETLTAEKDAAIARAEVAEAKQAELQGVIIGLEAALAAATAPPATAPPAVDVANTAASATTKRAKG